MCGQYAPESDYLIILNCGLRIEGEISQFKFRNPKLKYEG
jgi:hypothetical protein